MDTRTALLTVLDQVDYTAGNCRPNEMVGAVLPENVIKLAREACAQGDSAGHGFLTEKQIKEKWIEIIDTTPPPRQGQISSVAFAIQLVRWVERHWTGAPVPPEPK